jgi:hypothetical protein
MQSLLKARRWMWDRPLLVLVLVLALVLVQSVCKKES